MLEVKLSRYGGPNADEGVTKALQALTEAVLAEANKTVPLEEGTLQRSGQAEAEGKEAQVSYDTPYAVVQHEDPHLRHDPGRRDHWLEQAVEERKSEWAELVRSEMEKFATGK